jgi:cysteine desulfurase
MKIYFDYAATTPLDEDVKKEMMPFFSEKFGNPSSLHDFGQKAVFAIDNARERVAKFLNCKSREVVFTSSATEANNLAILGILRQEKDLHAITSSFEHKAVLEPLLKGKFDVDYLSVYRNGIVKAEDVLKKIKKNTRLVSIMYANSEIGTIQPIKEIGEEVEKMNEKRKKKIIFHTDASQAANYLSCNVLDLKVDLLTLSGHKMYGPKGAGVLFVKEGVNLSPIIYGASQERGLSSGTENVPAIVGFGSAIEKIGKNKIEKTKKLRDKLIDGILKNIEETKLNGDCEKRLPNNINISFKGAEGESLLIALDREGVAVSTGSACASHSLSPSYVLLSLGLSHEEAHGSLRITLGRYTKEEEVDYLLEKLPKIVYKLRKISGR